MGKTDYSSWKLSDLFQAEKDIKKAIEDKKSDEKQKMIEEFKIKAEALGIPLSELLEGIDKIKIKKTVIPKYKNPDNETETYSGRGRKPAWFRKCLENGINEEDLLIKK